MIAPCPFADDVHELQTPHPTRGRCLPARRDAAADMTLCTYLLQMREFFRWESGLAFSAPGVVCHA